jgi:prevent-host-death family protein
MTRMAASDARNEFSDTLNRVSYQGERIVLHRRGRDVAALVPLEDLETLQALEDHLDIEAARKALKEKGSISAEDLRAELGL